MSESARLGLQFLQAAQIQKEMTVNEGLARLDLAICAAVDGFLVDTPPVSPAVGNCFIIGSAPSGAWSGHPLTLAGYTEGGWRLIAPVDGLTALDKASGEFATFRSGGWEKGQLRATKLLVGGNQVVGARLAAISDPSGGTIIDAEARSAIGAILAGLRQHGLIAT